MNTTDGSNLSFAGISTAPSVMTPANVRQFSQALQGALARFIADEWAVNTVGGTGDAITITASQGWAAYATGQGIRFQTTAANATTSVTLNVNSIGAKAVRKISGGTDVALAAGDLVQGETYTLIYRASANSAAGAWVLVGLSASVPYAANSDALGATSTAKALTPANLAQERTLGAQNINVGLSASVNASALTVSLTGIDSSTPSATDPVTILFRNATAATGTPVSRLITGATSITVASTKTLGTSSSNVPFRIWIVAVDTGSGIELGVVNALSGTSIMALRAGIYSPTATPGNSAQVIYTTSGQTSKPIAILGWMEWASGLATAGTWASGPTTIKLWQPGDPLPGDTVQSAYSDYSTSATGTGIIPADNTIPQSTEGDQYMSQAITPMSASNVLRVASRALLGISGAAKYVTMALFRDAGANAIAVTANADNGFLGQMLMYEAQAGAVTATTFKVRAGQDSSGGTVQFGSNSGTRLYGAIPFASLSVLEVMA